MYSVEQNDIGAIVPAAVSEFPSTVANEKFQGELQIVILKTTYTCTHTYFKFCSHVLLFCSPIGYHLEQGRFFQTTMNDLLASGPKASSHKGQVWQRIDPSVLPTCCNIDHH